MAPTERSVRTLAAALLVLAALAAPLHGQNGIPELFLPAGDDAAELLGPESIPSESGAAVVRVRAAAVDTALLDPDRRVNRMRLNLFPGLSVDFVTTRPKGLDPAAGEWHGRSVRRASDTAVFTVRDGRANGNIVLDGRFYEVRHIADDLHAIREIVAQRPAPAADFVAPPSRPPPGALTPANKRAAGPPRAEAAGDPVVDLLVVYTPAAKMRVGGSQQIQDRIRLGVAEANAASLNSNTAVEFRLVGMAEVAPAGTETVSNTFLDQVTFYEPEIQALRDHFGADVVSVWIHPASTGSFIGIAWLNPDPAMDFAPYAVGLVNVTAALGPSYTFAHEAGHNLGLHHNRANASGQGAYSYAYGYRNPNAPDGGFYTIMSYSSNCAGCSAPNHWSNPDVLVNGAPSGVPLGDAAEAHNALALTNIAPIAANWRAAVALPPNGSPVAQNQVIEIQHDTPSPIVLTGTDPDGDPLRFVVASGPAHGSLSGSGPNRTYSPNAGYSGPDSFSFEVLDPYGGFGNATVALSILGPGGAEPPSGVAPGAPVVEIPFTSFDAGRALDTSGNGHHLNLGHSAAPEDADPTPLAKGVRFDYAQRDVLSYDGPSVGGVDFFATSASRFSFAFAIKRGPYWPPTNQYAIDAGHLDLRLYHQGANASIPAQIRGRGVSFGPFDNTRTAIVVARWDGQGLKLSVNGAPPVSHTRGGGAQQFLPLLFGRTLSTGSEYYHLLIWDQALSDPQLGQTFEYLCGVLGAAGLSQPAGCPAEAPSLPNQPPVALPQTLSAEYESPLPIVLTGSDPDGDPLTFSIVAGPSHGVLSGTPPSVVYTPAAGYSGPDSFLFAVSDGRGGSAQAQVSISVQPPPNRPPAADPRVLSTAYGAPLAILLTGSDPDGDPLTFSIVAVPSHGVLSGTPPSVVYTPAAGYSGPDSFLFAVSDGRGGSAQALVSIAVSPPPPSGGGAPGAPVVEIPFTSFDAGRALDTSGNGHHLNLGHSAAPEDADPTPLAKGVRFDYAQRDVLSYDGPSVGGVDFFATSASRFSFAFAIKRGPYWPPTNQYAIDAGHLDLRLYHQGANASIPAHIRGRGVSFGPFDNTRTAIVVARWDGQGLTLSVNGAPPVSHTRGGSAQQFLPLFFGRSLSTGSEYYHLLIWDQALSDTDSSAVFDYLCGELAAASLSRPVSCPAGP